MTQQNNPATERVYGIEESAYNILKMYYVDEDHFRGRCPYEGCGVILEVQDDLPEVGYCNHCSRQLKVDYFTESAEPPGA